MSPFRWPSRRACSRSPPRWSCRPSNPITKGKYELGHQLYFDPRVSLDGTVSCATCHNPDKGWTDGGPVSTGIEGQTGNRSAPTVLNTAYGRTMFWDGRAPSLEGQAQGPMVNPIEMGKQTYQEIVDRLRTIPGYKRAVPEGLRHRRDARRHGQGDRHVRAGGRPLGQLAYDKYNAGDMTSPLREREAGHGPLRPAAEHRRRVQARRRASEGQVHLCHVGANFTDEQFHNLGIGWDEKTKKFADLGRWAPVPIGAKTDAELGAFKTPTVRDVELTAPYMHDGSLKTLEEVVEHYDKGGNPNPALDKDMKQLKLTTQESADVVAFMKALTGEHKSLEELLPTLPPGPDGNAPDPRRP